MNTLTPDIHRQSDFEAIIEAVATKLEEDDQKAIASISQTSPPASPANSSITYDFRGANIGNVAHNVHGNQQTSQSQPTPQQENTP